ncbi:hypothetical protein vBSlqSZDD2_45 [Serratia phage vB_SlqS_ZDD2]|nr:hypothetical protein vBSlqSZDD2_45 [Serratia phage vB_SlqS_ZDD2]
MKEWIKLFVVDGRQVAAEIGENDDNDPKLCIRAKVEHADYAIEVNVGPVAKPEDETFGGDWEQAQAFIRQQFDDLTQEKVEALVRPSIEQALDILVRAAEGGE